MEASASVPSEKLQIITETERSFPPPPLDAGIPIVTTRQEIFAALSSLPEIKKLFRVPMKVVNLQIIDERHCVVMIQEDTSPRPPKAERKPRKGLGAGLTGEPGDKKKKA